MHRYIKLRTRMMECDVTQAYLAKAMGVGITYLSRRMCGHEAFDTEDMESMAKVLNIPMEKWLEYFYEPKSLRRGRAAT